MHSGPLSVFNHGRSSHTQSGVMTSRNPLQSHCRHGTQEPEAERGGSKRGHGPPILGRTDSPWFGKVRTGMAFASYIHKVSLPEVTATVPSPSLSTLVPPPVLPSSFLKDGLSRVRGVVGHRKGSVSAPLPLNTTQTNISTPNSMHAKVIKLTTFSNCKQCGGLTLRRYRSISRWRWPRLLCWITS